MTDEEREKMWKDIQKMIDDRIQQQNQQLFMQGNWGVQSSSFSTGSISPTDKDAKGRFPYQEPERDEQGTYYGYKILDFCTCGCGQFRSPRYPAIWENGKLQADREPSEQSMFGIHCTKRMDNPCLREYSYGMGSFLVHCALSGTIVETEQGFRAEYAQIIEVNANGHWESYQDYLERKHYDKRNHTYTWDDSFSG